MSKISSQMNVVEGDLISTHRRIQKVVQKASTDSLTSEESQKIEVLLSELENKVAALNLLQSDLYKVILLFTQLIEKQEGLINHLEAFINKNESTMGDSLNYTALAKLEMLYESMQSNDMLKNSYTTILMDSQRLQKLKAHLSILIDQLNLASATQGRQAQNLLESISE